MKFVIEHLEVELFPWCLLEYEQMSSYVGKENLLFTKVPLKDHKKLKKFGEVTQKSILELNYKKTCLLDPKATKIFLPSDSKQFDYFIFGGILGDHPEQGRTEKYLTSKLKNTSLRNLGNKQMSTDTAVLATKLILDGKNFEKLSFQDDLEVNIKNGTIKESLLLPYRYILINKKIQINPKLIDYLKKKKSL